MRILLGMNFKKALNTYQVPIPETFPQELLTETITFCGKDFMEDMEDEKKTFDKKIQNYFLSDRFLEEAELASFQLDVSDRDEAHLWLLMTYNNKHEVCLEVAENLKFNS